MLGDGRYKRLRADGQDVRPVEPEKSEQAKKTEQTPAKNPETEAESAKKSEPKTTKKSESKPAEKSETKPAEKVESKSIEKTESKAAEKSETKPAEKAESKSADSPKSDSTVSKRKADSSGVSKRSGEVVISSEAAEKLSRFFANIANMLGNDGSNGAMTYESAISAVEERIKLAENRAREAEARAKAAEEKLMEQSKPIGEKRVAEAGMTAEETEKFYANIDTASKAIDKAHKILEAAEERKAARGNILGKHF